MKRAKLRLRLLEVLGLVENAGGKQTADRQRGVVYGLSATTMDDMRQRR
jgi:hypothetical protein